MAKSSTPSSICPELAGVCGRTTLPAVQMRAGSPTGPRQSCRPRDPPSRHPHRGFFLVKEGRLPWKDLLSGVPPILACAGLHLGLRGAFRNLGAAGPLGWRRNAYIFLRQPYLYSTDYMTYMIMGRGEDNMASLLPFVKRSVATLDILFGRS